MRRTGVETQGQCAVYLEVDVVPTAVFVIYQPTPLKENSR